MDNNNIITRDQYQTEVESLAKEAHREAREYDRDLAEVIHETVDGHQWVIYHRYNALVLAHSDSVEAGADYGDLGEVLRSRGVEGLLSFLACAALTRDVEMTAYALADDDDDEDESEDESEG